jgi:hypothetical protein
MLQKYGRQLVNARRLARFKRSLRASGVEDEVTISREAKRRELIEKVAREIIENLIIAGSDNPIVHDITARLAADVGEDLQFTYPPSEDDLQIFRKSDQGPIEITSQEKIRILNRLWQITLDKVNDTML